MRVTSFPPIVGRRPRVLVLGTMPGVASLAARQYYAHPRNAFWPIMRELAGAGPDLPYAQRTHRLAAAGIALWDVLERCERPGSLDGHIRRGSEVPNDITGLLRRHPGIRAVLFNGGGAEMLFRRHLLEPVRALRPELMLIRLPSTSPANAGWSAARKLAAWRRLLEFLG